MRSLSPPDPEPTQSDAYEQAWAELESLVEEGAFNEPAESDGEADYGEYDS